MIKIRNEQKADYRKVEELTRKAFYNLYVPGGDEHYLVHIMRSHKDFVPELDFVIEEDGEIVGNIMYTKSKLVDEKGEEKEILTFGPLCVSPQCQRGGYGKKLMEHSFAAAVKLGYDTIVIFGSPSNYVSSGFVSCKRYNVYAAGDTLPSAMMVKELVEGALDGRKWTYYDSPVMQIDAEEAKKFDEGFEKMEKKHQASQEEFYILSQSTLE